MMATSTELLRAAEHMRLNASAIVSRSTCNPFESDALRHHLGCVADEIEREAKRLQAVEAQRDGTCEVCNGVGIRPGIPSWNDCAACGGHGRVFKSKLKRSWPDGWPPFAVLRRVYESIDSNPWPSVKWCERPGADWRDAAAARRVRREWVRALDDRGISNPSSP